MRKLKLQIQMTLDGFVAGPEGQLDWMWIGEKDESSFQHVIELADSADTILLGRKMTNGFVDYWENVADNQPDSPEHLFAHRMVDTRKIVFSRTQTSMKGRNVQMENGVLAAAIQTLKQQPGKDILVYGGADFVSSLIDENLIDEYYIFCHPVALGNGLSIFKGKKVLQLVSTTSYKNGKSLNKYVPV
ncbi:MAG: dihydrofolate reductase family protein [Chryseolinea sp.]